MADLTDDEQRCQAMHPERPFQCVLIEGHLENDVKHRAWIDTATRLDWSPPTPDDLQQRRHAEKRHAFACGNPHEEWLERVYDCGLHAVRDLAIRLAHDADEDGYGVLPADAPVRDRMRLQGLDVAGLLERGPVTSSGFAYAFTAPPRFPRPL